MTATLRTPAGSLARVDASLGRPLNLGTWLPCRAWVHEWGLRRRGIGPAVAAAREAHSTQNLGPRPATASPTFCARDLEGNYLGSESSMARVLREHRRHARRGRAKAPKASRPPTTHIATFPGQVWFWDMSAP